MRRYLDPKSDLVFKRIFGEHPHLLKSFLNAVLPLPQGTYIETLAYLPQEQIQELPGFKRPIVDVKCTDQLGRFFIVEMQIHWVADFLQRMLFNAGVRYVRQITRGDAYASLCHVYGLALINSNFTEDPEWYHHYKMMNVKNVRHTLDDIQLVLIELPKFKPSTLVEKKLTVLWLRFMSEIGDDTQSIDPALSEDPNINEALILSEESGYTEAQLETYSAYWDSVRTERALLEGTFRAGKEQGIEQGIEQGMQQKEIEIAKNLLANGLDPDFVSKNTGLALATVKKLQEDL